MYMYLYTSLQVLAGHPHNGQERGEHLLLCMRAVVPNLHEELVDLWDAVIPKLLSYLTGTLHIVKHPVNSLAANTLFTCLTCAMYMYMYMYYTCVQRSEMGRVSVTGTSTCTCMRIQILLTFLKLYTYTCTCGSVHVHYHQTSEKLV